MRARAGIGLPLAGSYRILAAAGIICTVVWCRIDANSLSHSCLWAMSEFLEGCNKYAYKQGEPSWPSSQDE